MTVHSTYRTDNLVRFSQVNNRKTSRLLSYQSSKYLTRCLYTIGLHSYFLVLHCTFCLSRVGLQACCYMSYTW